MRTKLRDATEFETFYKDVRSRLLLQTWALTADLPAGRKAVQDALAIAWHHWRKVGRLSPADREDWVRPIAWRHALRRHSVPHFHRAKGADDEESQATLDALAMLPLEQRKVFLLAHLTSISEDALAREVGITQVRAEQALRAASRDFALARSALPIEVRAAFEPMLATVEATRWPRPTILTRAGSARRRTHTAAGLALAVAAFAGSGFAVTDAAGDRPHLGDMSLHHRNDIGSSGPGGYDLSARTLVGPDQVGAALGGTWTTTLTSDDRNSAVALPCQRGTLADPHPQAALGRTFVGTKKSILSTQTTVASADATAATAAFDKTLGWYGGCRDNRVQLLSTEHVTGVGDQADVLLLRNWAKPQRTVAVGVARTGALTTAVSGTVPIAKSDDPAVAGTTSLLGQAVQQLCRLPGAGACTTQPAATPALPPATGSQPALMNTVDLPPVEGVDQPWVSTAPAAATANVAATRCDQTSFAGQGIAHAMTRSFVIPAAKGLAPEFGLTETLGSFGKQKAAAGFVNGVRDKLKTCPKKDLGSHVTPLKTTAKANRDVTAWRVRVETSKTDAIVYLMAIVRNGASVAQVGFVPSGKVTMSDADFAALADRAADRLTYLK